MQKKHQISRQLFRDFALSFQAMNNVRRVDLLTESFDIIFHDHILISEASSIESKVVKWFEDNKIQGGFQIKMGFSNAAGSPQPALLVELYGNDIAEDEKDNPLNSEYFNKLINVIEYAFSVYANTKVITPEDVDLDKHKQSLEVAKDNLKKFINENFVPRSNDNKAANLLRRVMNHLNEQESYEEAVSTKDLSDEIRSFLMVNHK